MKAINTQCFKQPSSPSRGIQFFKLPPELLLKIIYFLPSYKNTFELRFVSKKFYYLVRDYFLLRNAEEMIAAYCEIADSQCVEKKLLDHSVNIALLKDKFTLGAAAKLKANGACFEQQTIENAILSKLILINSTLSKNELSVENLSHITVVEITGVNRYIKSLIPNPTGRLLLELKSIARVGTQKVRAMLKEKTHKSNPFLMLCVDPIINLVKYCTDASLKKEVDSLLSDAEMSQNDQYDSDDSCYSP